MITKEMLNPTYVSKEEANKWIEVNAIEEADDEGDNDPLTLMLQEEESGARHDGWIMAYMQI